MLDNALIDKMVSKYILRNAKQPLRQRKKYIFLIVITVLLGLASRKYVAYLPGFVCAYAGDTLWATLVFWLVRFCFIGKPSRWVANIALAFAFSIEASQLYHVPWLDWLRNTTLGSLVLGHGFLWSDLACYTCGVALGYGIEKGLALKLSKNPVELVEVTETVH